MSVENMFNKKKLEKYLISLSKEFKKLNGSRMPAEIVLIGGAAVLLRYNLGT